MPEVAGSSAAVPFRLALLVASGASSFSRAFTFVWVDPLGPLQHSGRASAHAVSFFACLAVLAPSSTTNPTTEKPMPRTKPVAPTRRFATDQRSESQLTYLRHASGLAFGLRKPPSPSAIIRRAIDRYAEHVADLLEAGRLDGLPGPHPQDVAAETRKLADHARIVDAPPPVSFVDAEGMLQPWGEAIRAQAMQSLMIKPRDA